MPSGKKTRRDVLRNAGVAAAAGIVGMSQTGIAGAAAVRPASTGRHQPLTSAQMSGLFEDLFAVATNPERANTSPLEVLQKHGVTLGLPADVMKQFGKSLGTKKGPGGRGPVQASECGVCGACGVCAACLELNVGAAGAAAAAVWAIL
jgi:hypothetical protein